MANNTLPHELWLRGQRDGWIESLDWMMEVLDDEIDYQEQRWPHPDESVKILERILTIVTHRRKEWMLSGES